MQGFATGRAVTFWCSASSSEQERTGRKKEEECAAAPPFYVTETLGYAQPSMCFQVNLFLEGQAQMICYLWHITEPAPSFAFHGKFECGP